MNLLASFESIIQPGGSIYSLYQTIRVVFIFLDFLIVVGIIFCFVQTWRFRPRFVSNPRRSLHLKPLIFKKDPAVQKKWTSILENAESSPPNSFVTAILEADKFVDEILKKIGMQGEHMADRLESLGNSGKISQGTLDRMYRAHRIRNELVHAPEYEISQSDTESVLRIYKSFLTEFGFL